MADGTTEVTGGNVVGLAVDTGVSAGIGALFGKVTDVIGVGHHYINKWILRYIMGHGNYLV